MTGRVTICGAFGGVNIGDEAIAETMRTQIGRAFPGARIGLDCFVSRAVLESTGYTMPDTDIASRQDWHRVIGWLRRGPLVIGGGQMLNGSKLGKGPGYLLIIAALARLFGHPVMILGVGTRAIERFAVSRVFIRALAALSRTIRVRDIQSKRALIACGVPAARIEVTADVVFSGVVQAAPGAPRDPDHLCLAVHQSPLVSHYTPEAFAALALRLAQARGSGRVDLVCHDARPGYDLDFAQAVQRTMAPHTDLPVEVVVPRSVAETMQLYARAGVVVSSRMHPLILGLAAGAEVQPLTGSAKVADLAGLYGTGPLLRIEASGAEVAAALRPVAEGGNMIQGIPETLRAAALANFSDLDATR